MSALPSTSNGTPKSAPELSSETFKPLLRKLVYSPDLFDVDDFRQAFAHLTVSPLEAASSPAAKGDPAQIAAFLTALRLTGRELLPDFVAEAARGIRNNAVVVRIGNVDRLAGKAPEPALGRKLVCDIVGTGGDGHNTFNVSTAASIIAAGAGAIVCKHGNRASSSTSGSADVLLAMGVPITTLQPADLTSLSLEPSETVPYPFFFLYAPLYHPSFAALGPIRRLVGFPTIFNTLGPLVNPVRPDAMVIGVNRKQLGAVFADALQKLGVVSAWIVCGAEGLDEISIEGDTYVWEVKEKKPIKHFTISPASFGIKSHTLASVASPSSTAEGNAAVMNSLLSGELPETHPIENFCILNAAALLYVTGVASDYADGVKRARESVRTGRAKRAIGDFAAKANEAIAKSKVAPAPAPLRPPENDGTLMVA